MQYSCTASVVAHPKASISALGVHLTDLVDCFFSGGSDGAVKLWRLSLAKVEEVQTLDLKGKLPLDLAVHSLPGSDGSYSNGDVDAD